MPTTSHRVNQKDVAELAGVTCATVSRVLNNVSRHFSVRPEVRKKVIDAACALGYRPDLFAQSLRRKKNSGLVGWFGSVYPLDFSTSVQIALTEALSQKGLLVAPSYVSPKHVPIQLPWWRLDAAVVSGIINSNETEEFDALRIPYVCVDCACGEKGSSIDVDDQSGMRQALEHLLALGHRRIAYVTRTPSETGDHSSVAIRAKTFSDMMAEAGAVPVSLAFEAEQRDVQVPACVRDSGCTAFVTYSAYLSVLVHSALQKAGFRVPEDVSLVSLLDEYPLSVLEPPVTTVRVDGAACGRLAAEMVLERLADPGAEPRRVVLPEELVVRESTGPAPRR